jgi:hypothetical protein
MNGRTIVIASYTTIQHLGSVWAYNMKPAEVQHDENLTERVLKVYRKAYKPRPNDGGSFANTMGVLRSSMIGRWKKKGPSKEQHALAMAFFDTQWGMMIADEAHRCKDESSITTRSVALVQANYRLGLTGTPVMNKSSELQTIMRSVLHYRDSQGVSNVSSRLYVDCTLGRKKADVFPDRDDTSPEFYDVVLSVEGFPEDRAIYRSLLNRTRRQADDMNEIEEEDVDEDERALRARRLAAARSKFFSNTKGLQLAALHRDVVVATRDDLPTPPAFPLTWTHTTHNEFPAWFRKRVVTFVLCMRAHSPGSRILGRDIYRLICTLWARQEATIVQPSPKLMAMRDIFVKATETNPDEKMLVFSSSRVFLERLAGPYFNQRGIKALLLAGGMDKDAVIRDFKSPAPPMEQVLMLSMVVDGSRLDGANPYVMTIPRAGNEELIQSLLNGTRFPGCVSASVHSTDSISVTLNLGPAQVLVAVKKVAGVGLNFHDVSSTVVLCEPYWNASLDDQCVARVDRLGQTHRPQIYRLLLANSVDFAIRTVQDQKRAMGKMILEERRTPKLAEALLRNIEWNADRALVPLPEHPVTYNQRFLSLVPVAKAADIQLEAEEKKSVSGLKVRIKINGRALERTPSPPRALMAPMATPVAYLGDDDEEEEELPSHRKRWRDENHPFRDGPAMAAPPPPTEAPKRARIGDLFEEDPFAPPPMGAQWFEPFLPDLPDLSMLDMEDDGWGW